MIDEAYIKWLHEEHSWVPGAAELSKDAFWAGWRAAVSAIEESCTTLKPEWAIEEIKREGSGV